MLLFFYRRFVRHSLSSSAQQQLARALAPWQNTWAEYERWFATPLAVYDRWRVRAGVTRVLGPQYRRSRNLIEIDITWACNLACPNCNRSCTQAPTGVQMTVAQVQRFVDESVAAQVRWKRIRLIGGEPTLHKDFHEIVDVVRRYRDGHSPKTTIEVSTNGAGERVNRVLSELAGDIEIINSAKDGKQGTELGHISFNVAPDDLDEYHDADFRNGCDIARTCGTGLGPNGYYPCAPASAMDRIFGWNVGRQSLPDKDDSMEDLLDRCCRKCGHFKREAKHQLLAAEQVMSPSWERAYAVHSIRQAETRGKKA
jgi:hypothetical protein